MIVGFLLGSSLTVSADNGEPTKEVNKKGKSESTSEFTLSVPVEAVIVNTVVTDRTGNHIPNLSVDDFEIYENDKKQIIQSFTPVSYRGPDISVHLVSSLVNEENKVAKITASKPRLLSLVIDDLTFPAPDSLMRTINVIRDFVKQGIQSEDYISILTASRGYQIPFTQDRDLLLNELNKLRKKLDLTQPHRPMTCVRLTDSQAEGIELLGTSIGRDDGLTVQAADGCGVDNAEMFVENLARQQVSEIRSRSRLLLGTLRQYIRSLKPLEAQKSLVLFSNGLLQRSLRYELERVVDMALQVGVIFNSISIRGLEANQVFGVNETAFAAGELLARQSILNREDSRQKEASLAYLTRSTGGVFFRNSNDLLAGLQKIVRQQFSFYVLSYARPPKKPNGRFHKIRVKVSRPGVRVTHRRGYFSPKETLSKEEQKKRDMVEALQAPGELKEIPLQLSYHSVLKGENTYQLDVATKINLEGVPFSIEDGKRVNQIRLVVVVFDEKDNKYVGGDQKEWEFKLSDLSYASLLKRKLASKISLQVPAGRYLVKIVARESINSSMGSLRRNVELGATGNETLRSQQEKALLNAVQSLDPLNGLPVTFKTSTFYETPEQALVLVAAQIGNAGKHKKDVQWLPRKGISVRGVALSSDDKIVSLFGENIRDPRGEGEFTYRSYLKLPPGEYKLKLAASDRNGRLGMTRQNLLIPMLYPEAITSSSIVVSQSLEPFPSQIASLQTPEASWLAHRGVQVLAAPHNKVNNQKPLVVFYKLYNLWKSSQEKLTAKAQMINKEGKIFDFPTIFLDQNHLQKRDQGQVAVGFKLIIKHLVSGPYQLKITTEDLTTNQSITTKTPVFIEVRDSRSGNELTEMTLESKIESESSEEPPVRQVVQLDRTKIKGMLEIPSSSEVKNSPLKFQFRNQLLKCASIQGQVGYNRGIQGECGDLRGNDLKNVNLRGRNLFGANLRKADLSKADLRGAILVRADLTGAKLWEANLSGADLRGAKLTGAELLKANLRGTKLDGAELMDASLTGADLQGARLIGANLQRAILKDAKLNESNLQVADLSNAVLFGCDLRKSDLRGIKLDRVALVKEKESDLFIPLAGKVQIRRTRLAGAKYDDSSILPFDFTSAKALKMKFVTEPYKFKIAILDSKGSGEFTMNRSQNLSVVPVQPGGVPNDLNWPEFLGAVRRRVANYTDNLPDFLCHRSTRRYERLFQGWREKDQYEEELSYIDHEEHYELISNSKNKNYEQIGTYSIGEYAAALQTMFAPEAGTTFQLDGPEKISDRQTIRVAYKVPRATSSLSISYEGNPFVAGYDGFCWIDIQTHQVVQLTKRAMELPEEFPVKAANMKVSYNQIEIDGNLFWLPVRAQLLLQVGILESTILHRRNEIEFANYKRFSSGVRLISD